MAEFRISRFRYTWEGNWTTAVTYNRDDVVYYRGSAWVCIRQHTSSAFNADLTFIPAGQTLSTPAWVKMSEGRAFLGPWTSTTLYEPNDLVVHGGNLYVCILSHTSATYFNTTINNWEVFATGHNFRNTWTPALRYLVGDVVRYSGYTYQCVLEHVAGTISESISVGDNNAVEDSTAETWQIKVENYNYLGNWQPSDTVAGIPGSRYRLNDLVKYGSSILKCIEEHESSTVIDNSKFVTYLPGFQYDNTWNSTRSYASGDVVRHGGVIYTAVTNNTNSQPGSLETDNQSLNVNWTVVNKGITFTGEYEPGSSRDYFEGDVVRRGGALWVSLTTQYTDDSSLRPLDTSNWQLVIAAQNFRSSWQTDQGYNLYDVVYYRGTVYYATIPHNSSFENFPGDNGSGVNYWSTVLVGDQDAALTNIGDMLTYNLKRNIIEDGSTVYTLGDTSTIGTAPIAIGSKDQLLIVENDLGDIGYDVWGNNPRVYYVRTDGVDDSTDPDRGINYFKPWKTLAFALEKADDGYSGFTSIKLSTGQYDEVLPLIVPARTAVIGEELRSVTIRAGSADTVLAAGQTSIYQTLVHIGTILPSIIIGNLVSRSIGNTDNQIITITASNTEVVIVNNLWGNLLNIIDYKINATGSSPAVTGSNTPTANASRLSTIQILENNRSFIKAEFRARLSVTYPSTVVDTVVLDTYLDKFITALQYDLQYPGNYKVILEGRRYANAVIGSQLEDMFYVRDTTGIRNMTLRGLEGTLPAIAEGDTYSIPTGGAFVSLDPGWGPNDQRVWITGRSCYVQNVTTFGTAAVGQKVDGDLHNGGNRSIVSNDFTQVISDGIGAWMLNGGRGELVSVFSYYAHIGMFAQSGGIIRATNGNSSYGDFGAVADGIDPDETVRYGLVNTRTTQARVAAAFAGEVNDFILAVEFEHAGQEYTTAAYTITSSGVGAVAVQEEYRDNGMYVCYTLNGGVGYTRVGNQAQGGGATTIFLAAAESVTQAEILGKRIIITSGTGTGQYGYVQAYNPGTKILTVYRESDDQPGWDHITPGTPPATLFNTGTRYRIEPRPIFSHPGFTASTSTLAVANSWAAAVYGETSGTFTGIIGTAGTGITVDAIPAAAVFTVIKLGRTYSVTVTNGGAGYAVGDTIVIDGSEVGGTSVEHDITLTVSGISDDSTNSILAISVDATNIAASGKFVLAPLSGHFTRYSSNGDTWTAADFPTDGNWRCLAAGDNKFVAIAYGSANAASSANGVTWASQSMPSSRNWNSVAYGKPSTVTQGVFVAVAGNFNSAAYSTNGTTWAVSTMPTFGDSTLNEWVDIAFGYNQFVAIANSGNIAAVGTWNGTTLSWQGTIMDVVADSSAKNWVSVAYGNQRFVAVSSTGDVAYSFDGLAWLAATMPSQDGSTAHNWRQIRYGQGVFFAIGNTGGRTVGADPTVGPTTYAATSYDGIVWTSRTLADSQDWAVVAFGNPDVTLGDSTVSNSRGTWVTAPSTVSQTVNKIYTGARAIGRVQAAGISIDEITILEPGSGYIGDPVLTVIDPNATTPASFRPRIADGVLAQPTFTNKGAAYKTSTTSITVSGNGFADITPNGKFITIDGLTVMPGPGAQFYIAGNPDFFTAVLTGIDESTQADGTITSTFQISPAATLANFLEHGMEVLIRERYSQVRITGHDFLDIGTGNFVETNYPDLYLEYDYVPVPFQEVQNLNGGKVFYTSTDQSGNFRAGDLFAVEQATGIITISADFFDLSGLTELRLGGISVGSTAVVREFSKDPLFLQNSNSVIPTQRAVRSFLASRLNIGGEDLLTPSITAGLVRVGPNLIDNTAAFTIDIPVMVNIAGAGAGMSGSMLAQAMFYRSFKDD
jgi:hypothetical protein